MTVGNWTPDRIEQLRKLAEMGLSASKIARELGSVSRNGVISKMARNNIPLKNATGGQSGVARIRAARAPRKAEAMRPRAVFSASEVIGRFADDAATEYAIPASVPDLGELMGVPAEGVMLTDLERHHCRWPSGDPRSADFRYCGGPRIDGLSYCASHHRISIDPNRRV